jgi:hypothetical protein
VSGVVVYKQAPVVGGSVFFHPDASKGNQNPETLFLEGPLELDGSFVMTTNGKPGVPPGWYLVTVQTDRPRLGPPDPQAPKPTLLPQRYSDSTQTPLRCEIPPEGTTTLRFVLEPK